jgi:AraC-like DNA-binding protein
MTQQYRIDGAYDGHLITATDWLFSLVWREGGSCELASADGRDCPPEAFAIFLPPFSIVRVFWRDCLIRSIGLLSQRPLASTPAHAIRFTPGPTAPPHTAAAVEQCLLRARPTITISAQPRPRSPAGRAKTILDNAWDQSLSLSSVAREIGVAAATLTRSFRRELGLTPLDYRHRLQIMAALQRIATGQPIVDAAFETGFGDLSSFYRQFARLAHASPAQYRIR